MISLKTLIPTDCIALYEEKKNYVRKSSPIAKYTELENPANGLSETN